MFLNNLLAAGVSLDAQSPLVLADGQGDPTWAFFTNSIFVALLVVGIVLFFARRATRKLQLVPTGSQNLFEAIVETLYNGLEGIVGRHMVGKVFGLLATLFIYILVANWFALLPGVGSIGWGESTPEGFHVEIPLLRPATADLNMTLALALVFMIFWLYWTFSELGFLGFLDHTFGVKGGLTGGMKYALLLIFLFVGLIEIVSLAFRPVSLSLRLFGNVFAGENLLVTMITLGKTLGLPNWAAFLSGVIIPIPFYFLEILVGVLQAMVFTLLCAVYIQLSTTHDEGAH
ncbi:MAG: F0F1 ATP synthase subunit A [Chthoniobacterales bacterium]